MVKVKSHFKLFFGVLFVMLASFSLLGLWETLSLEVPWQTWPIGLIVVGVLFMVNKKGLAFVALGLMAVLGIFSAGMMCCGELGEDRVFEQSFDLEDAQYVDLSLSYGAGNIYLAGSDRDDISFEAFTRDFDDPEIKERRDGVEKSIEISRGSGSIGGENKWILDLSREVIYDLDLEYGIADVELDLKGLNVERLDISQGVSDTRIVFGEYPCKVDVEGGVSDIDFEFAEGSGVVIEAEGGLLDRDFDGFVKRNGKYYSDGFDEDGENIEIRFDGGVSDLNSKFY